MSWYSKKDVLKDLAQAMGGRFKDIDEQHIVVGEQPPPICTTTEDDDELLLRLKQGLAQDDKEHGPDLAGITEMLRMVDDFDDSKENKCTVQDNNNTVIISKLNPNVPEFNPKKSDDDKQPENVEAVNKNGIKKGETSSNTSEHIKQIEKLKNKIISPTNENISIKMKSERNIAIASLLKLYSDPPETSGVSEKQPKLLTPQHFEKPYVDDTKGNDASQTSSTNPPKKIVNECETREDENMKQEVDNSVAKVKSWLNMDEKPKTLTKALFLGPVTFKKKENVKPITPTSDVSEKTSSNSPSYVPTEYAEKLTETYKMRVKAKEERNLDMWSRLERDLKAKDEDIRRRNLQAGSNTKSHGRRRHQHAN
ncbi:uncharacterized protein LOC106713764 [Papilio machaon]|uniref:uncharacterized protein LOC106713764 n=1 Tax=Papilio machaon TaxID=76193 RepID=UPI001E665452|nr:uncharacterized protein LOC106713764 [Papilio machaon]